MISTKRRQLIPGCLALTVSLGFHVSAQTPASTILTIEMENVVEYQENFANLPKNGTSAGMETPISTPATFSPGYFIADIVAINGKKSRGTTFVKDTWVSFNPNPSGSQAVADIARFQAMEIVVEMAPTGNFAAIGGTGAFLGARGQAATIINTHLATSTFENPINRRTFPAGGRRPLGCPG